MKDRRETPVNKCQHKLLNTPEGRRPQLHRGGSLNSRTAGPAIIPTRGCDSPNPQF